MRQHRFVSPLERKASLNDVLAPTFTVSVDLDDSVNLVFSEAVADETDADLTKTDLTASVDQKRIVGNNREQRLGALPTCFALFCRDAQQAC